MHTFTDVFLLQDYANQTVFFPDENRPGEMASLSCQFNQFVTSKYVHPKQYVHNTYFQQSEQY